MSSYTYADGVIFVVNDDDVLQREKAKRYISHYLDRDLSRASDTLPFLFVISKKGPVGPGEHVTGLDEVDDFVDDLGLKDTALKLPFSEYGLNFKTYWDQDTLVKTLQIA